MNAHSHCAVGIENQPEAHSHSCMSEKGKSSFHIYSNSCRSILAYFHLNWKWFYLGDFSSPCCVWVLFEYPVSWCVLPPFRASSYRRKMMGLHCPWAPNNAGWRHLPKAILSRPIPALDRQTESVGQTVLRHSPYGKAGLPPTNIKGCQLFCHMSSRLFCMCSF